MSDIFDLFGEPDPVRSDPDNKKPPAGPPARAPEPQPQLGTSDPVVGPIGLKEPKFERQLADAVGELSFRTREFLTAPDLTMVAYAVADLLNAAGYPSDALAAERWATYEHSGRRSSKLEEAKARADAAYRSDLEAIRDGWEPLHQTESSSLPWRKPGAPTAPSRPPHDGPEPSHSPSQEE